MRMAIYRSTLGRLVYIPLGLLTALGKEEEGEEEEQDWADDYDEDDEDADEGDESLQKIIKKAAAAALDEKCQKNLAHCVNQQGNYKSLQLIGYL